MTWGLRAWRTHWRTRAATRANLLTLDNDPPLRAELFSVEQLHRHALALAGRHRIDPRRGRNRLLLRLAQNGQVLQQAHNLVTRAEREGRHVAPAGEWLLDNFHLIEQQIRLTRLHLPPHYSRELPRLLGGAAAGYPRVYDIALELIAHVDGRIDADNVTPFLAAYQGVTPLTLGELWAVPIMLRLGLIENLRRVSAHIARRWRDRNLATLWADRLLGAADRDSAAVLRVLAGLVQSQPPFRNPFVEEFCARLHGRGPAFATVQSWVQHRLAEQGLTREQLQRADNQAQAADQLSIGNSIGSLRFLDAMDWRRFVEQFSVVEQTLRLDPAGIHAGMDFPTRDRYRHVVEGLAARSRRPEAAVAGLVVDLARSGALADGPGARAAHVGHYLVGQGLPLLELAVGARGSVGRFVRRLLRKAPVPAYLGSLAAATALLSAWLLAPAFALGWRDGRLWLLVPFGVIAASQLAVTLVNLAANRLVGPLPLPRMDFSRGIPADCRGLVVIPTLLTSAPAVRDLLEGLEIRFLGNRDPHLRFGLLTDFRDADAETQPDDGELLAQARDGIRDLNARHGSADDAPFHLFHRPRLWNPHERVWMGYERKRGKLEQLNALLRGESRDAFSVMTLDPARFAGIRYVITLDTDTALPRDAARKLVGTLAHPLNRPRFDPATGRVAEGYAILQPRTPVGLLAANRSRFAQLSAGEAGIDPYTREVSDVYQDLFAEGSYVGKGIYDVDAFRQATAGRFPENLILSHDLVESGYARSALVSDLELHEDHPAVYIAEMSRRHRWIRGDWQIAGWLLPRVRGPAGRRLPNTLGALGWWKILDNLRRSLVPPALFALLLAGWVLTPALAGAWTRVVLLLVLLPVLPSLLLDALGKPGERTWGPHLRAVRTSAARQLAEAGLRLATLPYEALIHLDAILASGGRMLFTRRGLLLWSTPAYVRRNARTSLAGHLREMWIAPAAALAGLGWLCARAPGELLPAGPALALWLAAPLVAWWISRPLRVEPAALAERDLTLLHGLARRTWRYFEALVNAGENWLPPDNIQEVPVPTVASRTSPTNIGMALLANLAAHDFGYLTTGQLLERTRGTLGTLERLERHRGHFYNWYDTRTLRPMRPLYVSTVDSGNLAGSLLTLRAGLAELRRGPLLPAGFVQGLRDTLRLASPAGDTALWRRLCSPPAAGAADLPAWLRAVREDAAGLTSTESVESREWAVLLQRQCEAGEEDLRALLANAPLPAGMPVLAEWAEGPGGTAAAAERMRLIDSLSARCTELARMDFGFLYDPARDLLSIGYNAGERRLDPSFYDLLASEARLGSFVLIAQGQLPQEHWFALGRQLTTHDGAMALLSWSGSMFEYLMPLLVMPSYAHTLLDQTCRAVVARQIEYGRQRGVPWGVSESGYNATDAQGAYQYGPFGVPGLGLKRGLDDDLVVAPYATMLALLVAPREACRNLEALAGLGGAGLYGLHEAIDFTPSRVPRGQRGVVIRSFMAHHQGMSLLALDGLLQDRPMQRRFLSDPSFKAAELLLQERVPRSASPLLPHAAEVSASRRPLAPPACAARTFLTPHTPAPGVHLLSNGRYHVMVTNAGGGYSRWRDLAVTRWREDATCDGFGTFGYLRDRDSGMVWSPAFLPTRRPSKRYEAIFGPGRAEFRRRDESLDAHTEIAVSPEDDVEVRRVTLTNLSARTRTIEFTSYAEVVIAPHDSDLAHPAFSGLFVRTEILPGAQAILCARRARAPGERTPWMFHLMTRQGLPAGVSSAETDRGVFLGRGRSVAHPAALDRPGPLGLSEGAVLDPIVAIRQGLVIEPDTPANWHVITGMAATREEALALVEKYGDPSFAARAFDLAWSHSRLTLHQLRVNEAEAQTCGRLAGSILFVNPAHRAPHSVLSRNRLGQSGLWTFGISGDLPILLLRIGDAHRVHLVHQALVAHAYWREHGLRADLVILNEDFSGYRQVLQDRIVGLIAASPDADLVDKPGGVFLRRSDQLSEDERVLMQTVARVILTDGAETLARQVEQEAPPPARIPRFTPVRSLLPPSPPVTVRRELAFFNGLGGFTPDGREYVITLDAGRNTPAPWVNVLANARIGTVVSESGSACTWVDNAHEFRLTPWHNDPVGDAGGEAFYVRDEHTGQFWSPTPLPVRGSGGHVCRHGFGYSVFEHAEFGIDTELWTYVAVDAPVKLVVVRVRNRSGRARRLSVTGYWDLVLGQWRHTNLMHVVTEVDPASGALFARNPYNREFAEKVVFVHVAAAGRTFTASRAEFLGRNGTPANPAAMRHARLSGQSGANLDPCAALQAPLDLGDGEERELVFVLGAGANTEEAQTLVRRFSDPAGARLALEGVWEFWKRTLGVVHVQTPDPALNVLVNGWLEYQTLACRFWGRSGFYQSGGAYGFRDQLQDASALLHAAPGLAREHLLRCAGRQFVEGDVQHWWHPPGGRGVRTHISDDLLWLPWAICRYVTLTGDTGVLEESAPFLAGRPVNAGEESYYDLPQFSGESGSLYEHGVRAIRRGLSFGAHGLPLMGGGDWNDGMNLVGAGGRGESVWLAFFLFHVLRRFSELARRRGDGAFADQCEAEAARLRRNIEAHAWDGDWYRRAFLDDGSPLGSAGNTDCRIDSIAQSWAVLSGAAEPGRARAAMAEVDRQLVRRDPGLIQLFDPPFDRSAIEPGYVKGYPPGVRENGGQYTHAAIWVAMAFAELGDGEKAWELFSLLNPVRHAADAAGAGRYRVEPYVVAADVYAVAPHAGRGGWTWYTGSAGWMYRLVVETLLGLRLEVDRLSVRPLLPRAWDALGIHYRHHDTFYHIAVRRATRGDARGNRLTVDGRPQADGFIHLVNDRAEHAVLVEVGSS